MVRILEPCANKQADYCIRSSSPSSQKAWILMMRRFVVALLVSLPLWLVSSVAWSGSYLNRAVLLLEGSRAERDMVLPRSTDEELLRVVHGIAQARTRTARTMAVPKSVVAAHPHLLLVLENSERAYAAALDGNHQKFVEHILRARTEDKTFRAIIAKLGYTLPPTK